jgi:hypothetical protein
MGHTGRFIWVQRWLQNSSGLLISRERAGHRKKMVDIANANIFPTFEECSGNSVERFSFHVLSSKLVCAVDIFWVPGSSLFRHAFSLCSWRLFLRKLLLRIQISPFKNISDRVFGFLMVTPQAEARVSYCLVLRHATFFPRLCWQDMIFKPCT